MEGSPRSGRSRNCRPIVTRTARSHANIKATAMVLPTPPDTRGGDAAGRDAAGGAGAARCSRRNHTSGAAAGSWKNAAARSRSRCPTASQSRQQYHEEVAVPKEQGLEQDTSVPAAEITGCRCHCRSQSKKCSRRMVLSAPPTPRGGVATCRGSAGAGVGVARCSRRSDGIRSAAAADATTARRHPPPPLELEQPHDGAVHAAECQRRNRRRPRRSRRNHSPKASATTAGAGATVGWCCSRRRMPEEESPQAGTLPVVLEQPQDGAVRRMLEEESPHAETLPVVLAQHDVVVAATGAESAAATVAEAGSRPEGGVRATDRQRKRGPSRGQSWWSSGQRKTGRCPPPKSLDAAATAGTRARSAATGGCCPRHRLQEEESPQAGALPALVLA